MDAEPERRDEFEGLAVDPDGDQARARSDLELVGGEFERVPTLITPSGQRMGHDVGRLRAGGAATAKTPSRPASSLRRCERSDEAATT